MKSFGDTVILQISDICFIWQSLDNVLCNVYQTFIYLQQQMLQVHCEIIYAAPFYLYKYGSHMF